MRPVPVSSTAFGLPKAVLETGTGRITLCEVHVRQGPGYGLMVEPCSDDEIRRHVSDFASFLLRPTQPVPQDDDESESASPGVSGEIERAIRNMAGLRRRRADRKSVV